MRRAREVLGTLEGEHRMVPGRAAAAGPTRASSALFADASAPIPWSRSFGTLDLDTLTPLEALNRLAELQRRAGGPMT